MGFFLLVATGLLALANARPQYGNGKIYQYRTKAFKNTLKNSNKSNMMKK